MILCITRQQLFAKIEKQQQQEVVVDNTSIASSTFNSRNQENSHNAASMNSSYGTSSSSSRNNRNLWSRLRQQVRRGSHLLEAASVAATVTREGTTKRRTILEGNTEDTSHNEGYADEDEDDEDRVLNELTSLLADSRMQDMGNVGGDGDNDDDDTGDSATRSSSEELRDAAIRTFQHQSTISPQLCLLMILVYIMLSICIFHFLLEPEWTIIDSSYFAVVTFTTLGTLFFIINQNRIPWVVTTSYPSFDIFPPHIVYPSFCLHYFYSLYSTNPVRKY